MTQTEGVEESTQELGQSFLLAGDAEIGREEVFDRWFVTFILAEAGRVLKDLRGRADLNGWGEGFLADFY